MSREPDSSPQSPQETPSGPSGPELPPGGPDPIPMPDWTFDLPHKIDGPLNAKPWNEPFIIKRD